MKELQKLVHKLSFQLLQGSLNQYVKGIHYDSRQIKEGYLFVAIEGFRVDGHRFIPDALERGAVALVVEKPVAVPEGVTCLLVKDSRRALSALSAAYFDYPSRHLNLIGVTGTNGKTTTTHLIEAILQQAGEKVGLLGTIVNRIGDRELPAVHTTPESLDLQALLAQMVEEEVAYAVMEVSSHALALDRTVDCEYDVGVFTNLSQDHLDFHQNMQEYLKAKGKLFASLGSGVKKRKKYAVINADDPQSAYLRQITSVPVVTYGLREESDVQAKNIDVGTKGVRFQVVSPSGEFPLNLKLTGKFTVYNALAAVAVGMQEGIPEEEIKQALEGVTGVAGRFELVDCGQEFAVVVDYAHTPDGLKNLLETAREMTKGRIITVFGCGGDRDRGKRPLMGEVAARYSDFCIVTSDNPRSEEPEAIIQDIIPGVEKITRENYKIIVDRYQAIREAIAMARRDDMVIIAGKGHETYQIIQDKILPFDDRKVAREILRGYGYDSDDV
ncbi:UDP-N-acetylmuramoyl-L-alanyl-D-glutamate--2,6-diaminopimelate ligase [Calderihabitans maritimus]|uniref:UDP-N-acetylmuramoyl-L-alanyl-D-glutamate--2,6-diaminopimelate ligase n=1 Tax=Calderihabitans maritimus TaxID=1246530 RepID=A0A1Z5HRJ2_9FIRM|nr:UDP-N-acetylmuramoyl-L-alanyl-D-glutamate--2,6-diaminopimelate ligase [Calderihabitans maritimus]GAW92149.1 UDP-N-acetylmuramoylalanyl-D-glutamate--2,6-diaminopimelate ligase [Calderihabitans maritimus]